MDGREKCVRGGVSYNSQHGVERYYKIQQCLLLHDDNENVHENRLDPEAW